MGPTISGKAAAVIIVLILLAVGGYFYYVTSKPTGSLARPPQVPASEWPPKQRR